jgi:D-alanine-D-alanine ligase
MELLQALEIAFQNDYKAVLEQTLVGREIECAVMGNDHPVASCVGEILPTAEFYDYEAKYIDNSTGLAIPANLPYEVSERVRAEAVKAYSALGCTGLSRVDFFLLENGDICLNEINTLPGFTSISMFPKLFGQVGVPYSELIDRLIEYAEERMK